MTKQINSNLRVTHFTGDGDSKSHKGVDAAQSGVTHLKDIRHLSNSLKREINKAPFSKGMFSGVNKTNLKNRFALSVKSRCIAELNKAHAKYNGNLKQINSIMPGVICTIIMCFKG